MQYCPITKQPCTFCIMKCPNKYWVPAHLACTPVKGAYWKPKTDDKGEE